MGFKHRLSSQKELSSRRTKRATTVVEVDDSEEEIREPAPKRARSTKKKSNAGAKGQNWGLLAGIWPVDERPETLRDPEVVEGIDLNILLTLHTKWEDKKKREAGAGGGAVYKLDQIPPPKDIKACRDNGIDVLSEGRLERHPLGPISVVWAMMPQFREHIYRTIDLRPYGSDSQVPEATIGIVHDRRQLLKMEYFCKINANMSTRHLKVRTEHEVGGSSVSTTTMDWKEISSMKHVQDALINYEIINRLIWPLDFTGIVMLKLLNEYMYLPYGDEKGRVIAISAFFQRVSNANRKNTGRFGPPLDYKEQEEELKKVLRDKGMPDTRPNPFTTIPKVPADQKSLLALQSGISQNQGQGTSNRGGRGRGNRNNPQRPRLPTVQGPSGKYLCWHYNDSNCTRAKYQDGCKDPATGKEYSHHCMHQNLTTMAYCMARHPKHAHK